MKNFDDKLILKELASIISRLENVLNGLKNPNIGSLEQAEDVAPGLRGQWQKLFTNSKSSSDPVGQNSIELTAELEKQLLRLQNGHDRLARIQALSSENLRLAAEQLHVSGACTVTEDERFVRLLNGEASSQNNLWQLFEFYQQALNALINQDQYHEAYYHKFCSRLQQLVEELHFSGPVAFELTKIRRQLLQPIAREDLPNICLRLIDLTIEGLRHERKSANQFLIKLHGNLEEVHQYAAITLSEEQALCDARAHNGHHIAGELRAIGEHIFNHENAQLKAAVEVRIRNINHILMQNDRLQEREQALLKRMQEMTEQISEAKKEAKEFQRQLCTQNDKLFIDSLTQIYNRAGMDQRLEVEYRQWLRHGQPLCIALLDIDFFKEVNDKFGHLAGDKALRMIARTLQKSLRESDFVARFGGEEFTVILSNINRDRLEKPLQKLREQVKKIPFRFKEEPVTITISLGATLFKPGDSINSALERADQALYRAKHAGRDQIVID